MKSILEELSLSISLVVFQPDLFLLQKTLSSLSQAVDQVVFTKTGSSIKLVVVDNSASQNITIDFFHKYWKYQLELIWPGKNLGYGLAHNQAIAICSFDYHLVINPDVVVEPEAIQEAVMFLYDNPEVGMVTPRSSNAEGKQEYLCKAYPSVMDLLLRGFAPKPVKLYFQDRLDVYEMRDLTDKKVCETITVASGCFMLFRQTALQSVKGFSNDFFLYFEDFDLSLRLSKKWRIAYVPSVKIVHHGGNAAKKGIRHIFLFARSAYLFFSKHGWRFC